MLLPAAIARGVADGSVTLAFRRWAEPRVKVGSTFRTAAGVIRVESVDAVDPDAITDDDARAAGVARADTVRRRLRDDASLTTYRVRLSWAGPDPRVELRSDAELSDEDVRAIDVRLERLDRASSHGPWTMAVLDVIRRRPATRAADLAEEEFERERDPFKIDVRKLKNLGLTHSLEVGYELSPRGVEYLRRTTRALGG
jgi:hypothetical protein